MGYTDVPGVLRVAPFIEYGCHGVQFGLSGVTQGGERQERDFCNRPPVPLGLRVVPFDSRAQSRVDGGLAGDAGHQFSRYSIGPEHVVKDRIGARERELQSWRPNDEERSNYRIRNVDRVSVVSSSHRGFSCCSHQPLSVKRFKHSFVAFRFGSSSSTRRELLEVCLRVTAVSS